MKKIVILSAFLTPFRSGAEACAEEVPLALSSQFDFTIVTSKLRRDLPREDSLRPHPYPLPHPHPEKEGKAQSVRVLRIGIGHPIDKWLFPVLAPFAARKLKPDIVHAVLETFAGLALVVCAFTTGKAKRILTCQTTNRTFLKKMIVRSPDTVTVISSALQRTLLDLSRGDVTVIPNGIHTAMFRSVQKVDGLLLFVGRLEKMKGIDTLLRAFARLQVEGCRLRIVGDGSQREELEQLAKALEIADRVTFVGRVSPDEIAHEYEQAQIFCGLSRSEALGNVFLESQAAGCAIVATNIGGIPDIIRDHVNGLLVQPNYPDAAASAISMLLQDEELRTRLSESSRKNATAYDWSIIAQKYAQLY